MKSLQNLYDRDLTRLKDEIALYNRDEHMWKTEGNIANSAGNLCLHLIGNLNHFIGAVLGQTSYQRDRQHEFDAKDVPKQQLLTLIDDTRAVVTEVLKNLPREKLSAPYPHRVFGHDMTTEHFLIHLITHLNYHLGQINYHRRLMDATS